MDCGAVKIAKPKARPVTILTCRMRRGWRWAQQPLKVGKRRGETLARRVRE